MIDKPTLIYYKSATNVPKITKKRGTRPLFIIFSYQPNSNPPALTLSIKSPRISVLVFDTE